MANGIRQTNSGVVQTSSGVAQTVTTGAGLTTDDFESYSTGSVPSPYTSTVNADANAGVVTTDANSGSQSLNIQTRIDGNFFVTSIKNTFTAKTPNTLEVAYYETSSAFGGAIRWLSSNGDELAVVGTGNPQVMVRSSSGVNTLTSSPSPNYSAWRRFTLTLDFANGTFDVLWEDLDGSSADKSLSGLSFIDNPSDVAEIQFGGDERNGAPMAADSATILIDDSDSLP